MLPIFTTILIWKGFSPRKFHPFSMDTLRSIPSLVCHPLSAQALLLRCTEVPSLEYWLGKSSGIQWLSCAFPTFDLQHSPPLGFLQWALLLWPIASYHHSKLVEA